MKKCGALKFAFLLMITSLFIASGCSSQNSSTDTQSRDQADSQESVIKIGVIVAETGAASTIGFTQVNTLKMLQEQLNEQGPINGKKIELVKQDFESDDTKAVIALDKLISEGAVAVVGASLASTTNAISPKAAAAKVPLMASAPVVSKSEYVYNFAHDLSILVAPAVEYLEKNNITKVAWINSKDGFGLTGFPAFEEAIKNSNIEIVAHEEFEGTATDTTVQLSKIKSANPEAIIVWGRTPGAGIVARNFKALGMDIPMIQSTAAQNQGFLDQVKDNNENIFVIGSKLSVADQLPDSEFKERLISFKNSYSEKFNGEPDIFSAHLLDGVTVLVEAIKAGNETSEEIQQYLQTELGGEQRIYDGITGTFDFKRDQSKLVDSDGLTLLGIENNTWKLVK